jgi:hypothetical protein
MGQIAPTRRNPVTDAVRIVSDDWLEGYQQGLVDALADPERARTYLAEQVDDDPDLVYWATYPTDDPTEDPRD